MARPGESAGDRKTCPSAPTTRKNTRETTHIATTSRAALPAGFEASSRSTATSSKPPTIEGGCSALLRCRRPFERGCWQAGACLIASVDRP